MSKLFLPLILFLLIPSLARADGGFFFAESGIGHSADQQAILFFDPEEEQQTMVLLTGQDWESPSARAGYAWVVPVPSLMRREDFTVLEDGRLAFDELAELTEPRAYVWASGCSPCAAPLANDGSSTTPGVSELASFSVERYDIHILSATESQDLQGWLLDRDYAFPTESVPILQHYIDRGWYFTAVQVAVPDAPSSSPPDSTTATEEADLPSAANDLLQMTFTTSKPIFPLRISAVSSRFDEPTEVLLYIFAPYRVEARNYATPAMSPIERSEYSTVREFRDIYQSRYNQLRAAAENKAFVVEYAAPHIDSRARVPLTSLHPIIHPDSTYFLTRLRAELWPEQMDDDVLLVRAPSDDPVEITALILPSLRQNRRPILLATLALPFAFGALLTRRRQSWLQAYLLATLILAL
jgi:hypothetical protein